MTITADISVVIPAYQSEAYIEACIRSVLQHTCVKQVVVADDGSTDATSSVIRQLADEDDRVEYVTHPDGKNHGAGPTRNLAISRCRCAWIAFLDADDLWLPQRFDHTFQVLEEHPEADGVYECLGIQFETEEAAAVWKARHSFELTTLQEKVTPDMLIYSMAPLGKKGWFSGDALIVKKSLLEACGGYSDLRLSQDTELFMKLALKGRLYAGNIDSPVAVRRVHGANRITAPPERFFYHRIILWRQFTGWCLENNISGMVMRRVWMQHARAILIYARWMPGMIQRTGWLLRNLFTLLRPSLVRSLF